MKTTVTICLLVLVSAAACQKYTDRYDQVNVEEVLSNGPLLESYFKCITDKARCSPEGKELKEHLKEAIETECAKCTENQRKKAHVIIIHLIRNKYDHWRELCQKYDTTHTYCPKYEQKYKN